MRKLFLLLIVLGLLLAAAAGVFIFYLYPQKLRPEQEYRAAVKLLEAGDDVPAALQFESMRDYKDSAELAKRAWLAAGEKSFDEGDLAQSRTYYLKGGANSELLSKLDSAYYQMGVKAYAANQRIEAENCFSCISSGSSYIGLLDQVRISCAERFLQNGDFDSAQKVFHLCGVDSRGEISGLWKQRAMDELAAFGVENATFCFAKAMAYTDQPEALLSEMDGLWAEAGARARESGDIELASKCFARTSSGSGSMSGALETAYNSAVTAYDEGRFTDALRLFCEASGYSDSDYRAETLRELMKDYYKAGGQGFCAALEPNGAVTLIGDWATYSAPSWHGVQSIAVGSNRFILGIKDGGVLFHGNGAYGNAQVASWQDVISVACGESHSVGLLADGTVVACGPDIYGEVSGVSSWSGVKAISAGKDFTIGLKNDGTLVSCGDDSLGQCGVEGVSDAAAVVCGAKHTVVLKNDGTAEAFGDNSSGQCDVSGWTDIVAVYAGATHTVAVKADGSLTACGDNSFGQCAVEGVDNVLSAACGNGFTIILQNDGTVIKRGNIQ